MVFDGTAAVSAVGQRECVSAHYTKIGDAGGVRRHVCSTSPSWTLDQPGTVKNRRDDAVFVSRRQPLLPILRQPPGKAHLSPFSAKNVPDVCLEGSIIPMRCLEWKMISPFTHQK